MKKQDRELYIELTREIGGNLCVFCKHAEWESSGCDEGYAVCVHPIESLSTQNVREEDLTPGDDCYGFTPNMPVFLIADIVGAIISQGWDTWFFRRYSKTSVTIYGERYRAEGRSTSKVRIG